MDDTTNNPTFPSAQGATTPPDPTTSTPDGSGQAPVPTWLPNQTTSAPDVAPTPPNTSWPEAPQDHGTVPTTSSWNPTAETSPPATTPNFTPPPEMATPTPAQPDLAPAAQTWPSDNPSPAAPSVSATPDPVSASPTALETPPLEMAPAAPAESNLAPAEGSVFPPQFSQASTDSQPTGSLGNPIENNPASSWNTPTFIPPVDPSQADTSSAGLTPPAVPATEPGAAVPIVDHTAPTVPDFLSGSPASTTPSTDSSGFNLSTLNQTNSLEAQPDDLSQMTENSQPSGDPSSPVYTPPVSSSEPAALAPSAGIPETVTKSGGGSKKWLIIAGVLVILLLIAGGAYYFLSNNNSNSPEQNFSLPANSQAPLTNPPKQITPTNTPLASSSASPDATTSAFEKLKQQTSTP